MLELELTLSSDELVEIVMLLTDAIYYAEREAQSWEERPCDNPHASDNAAHCRKKAATYKDLRDKFDTAKIRA